MQPCSILKTPLTISTAEHIQFMAISFCHYVRQFFLELAIVDCNTDTQLYPLYLISVRTCLVPKYQCTTETTILVQVQYQNRNPNQTILLADTVTNTEATFQRENLVTNSMYGGIFSIIKGPLKPNLLPNIKDFQIIFKDLCSISSF